ncbi:MAG: DUF4126 family protein [Candidatus Devosia phytovorans]|uniref:DUF4126 family protein n=1 Tax=Candidatus Devosia phytovorans TaxID=3121372 RepID=A0AAJ5VXJ4_9HYPH|nr:DUF4126 family protein [Devosia sp.]WEK05328.1 MAG: DUF4126 family protein [Devosia sp.]
MIYILAILIGFTAGLRAMTPLAAVSWGAYLGWIDLSATPLAFLGNIIAVIIITLIAIGELITDQLPSTPSRKVPVQFGTRIVLGALTGALLIPSSWIIGLILGAIGAVIGTYLGAELRGRLAKNFGQDRPAALIEDALAIILAFLVVYLA